MTTITCDLCGRNIEFTPIRVELRDGEHPHSGSRMTKVVDVCVSCILKIPALESNAEYDDLHQKLKIS